MAHIVFAPVLLQWVVFITLCGCFAACHCQRAVIPTEIVPNSLALLKAQVSLQLGKVFSPDNGVSVSVMYSSMY